MSYNSQNILGFHLRNFPISIGLSITWCAIQIVALSPVKNGKSAKFQLEFLTLVQLKRQKDLRIGLLKQATGLCSKGVFDTLLPWRIILSPYFTTFET